MKSDIESATTYFHFPSDGFLLMQSAIALVTVVFAFREYVNDQLSTSMLIVALGGFGMLMRARFKTRPPECASIDEVNKVLSLKQRWPSRAKVEIDIRQLVRVEAYVQRFRKFPHTVVELNFDGADTQTIYFDVESDETRFLATPSEVIPSSVDELVKALRAIALERTGDRPRF